MAFDPQAPTQQDRDNSYRLIWLGLAFSLILLVGGIVPTGIMLAGLPAVFLGVYVPYFAFSKRYDEHFVTLRNHGFSWAMSLLGAWLLIQGILAILGAGHSAGYAVGVTGEETAEHRFLLPAWFNSAHLLASLMLTAFHAGFLKAQFLGTGE